MRRGIPALVLASVFLSAAAPAQEVSPPAPGSVMNNPIVQITARPGDVKKGARLVGNIHFMQPPPGRQFIIECFFICSGPDGRGLYVLNHTLQRRSDANARHGIIWFAAICHPFDPAKPCTLPVLLPPAGAGAGDGNGALQSAALPDGSKYAGWILRVSTASDTLFLFSEPPALADAARSRQKLLGLVPADPSAASEPPGPGSVPPPKPESRL